MWSNCINAFFLNVVYLLLELYHFEKLVKNIINKFFQGKKEDENSKKLI